MAGLTEDGLSIKLFPDVLQDLEISERTNISPNINTQDNELLGQLNNIISLALSGNWELLQAVYDSGNLLRAEGVHLDNLVALIGIKRLAATYSSTEFQYFTGENGTSIPTSVILENPITLDQFSPTEEVELDVGDCYSAKYSVKELLDSTEYVMTINGNTLTYTSGVSATEQQILDGIAAYNTANYSSENWTVTVDTPNQQLIITTTNSNNLGIGSTTYIGPDEVSVYGPSQSLVIGPISAPLNSVTSISSGVGGLTSTTNNISAYVLGREKETDEELRQRALSAQQVIGTATVEAIQDKLRDVDGVVAAIVEENESHLFSGGSNLVTFDNTSNIVEWTSHTLSEGDGVQFSTAGVLPAEISPQDVQYWVINVNANDFQISTTLGGSAVTFTDDGTGIHTVLIGRPPKSFESIVQGGTDSDIASSLWLNKPAGISTFGNTSATTEDSNGLTRTLNFSRPTAVALEWDVDLVAYDEESSILPSDYQTLVEQAIIDFTASLEIGQDVVPSRYYSSIQNAASGFYISSLGVRRKSVGGSYATTQLVIETTEYTTVISSDIDISLTS